jgi:hypothetical protein
MVVVAVVVREPRHDGGLLSELRERVTTGRGEGAHAA